MTRLIESGGHKKESGIQEIEEGELSSHALFPCSLSCRGSKEGEGSKNCIAMLPHFLPYSLFKREGERMQITHPLSLLALSWIPECDTFLA